MSAIVLWIALLWAGYLLVFSASEAAVVNASTGAPADFWEHVYFTGYTLSTLGLGDYVPQGNAWRVLTAAASLSGLFLVTLSITYLVLHFFHSRHAREAVAPRLAALDEALLAVSADARGQDAAPPLAVHVARQAIGGVLETLDTAFIQKSDTAPSLQSIQSVQADDHRKALEDASSATETRRRLLLAFVQNDGWTWAEVLHPEDDGDEM